MIQIDVHFWNKYALCQRKKNQSKEPRDIMLNSKIGIASIKHHIWCREKIQSFWIIFGHWTDI